jgi:hypothetical protein
MVKIVIKIQPKSLSCDFKIPLKLSRQRQWDKLGEWWRKGEWEGGPGHLRILQESHMRSCLAQNSLRIKTAAPSWSTEKGTELKGQQQ